MSYVKISIEENMKYIITANQIKNGCAYEGNDGSIVIGNITNTISDGRWIVAFCIDGSDYYYNTTNVMFREIDMHIKVGS